MSSTVSSAAWLQATLTPRAYAPAAPAGGGGRHRAPEVPGTVDILTSEQIASRAGRHAEPE